MSATTRGRYQTHLSNGQPKRERYGWVAQDGQGQPMVLDKFLLQVDETYQRSISKVRIAKIARDFTWAAYGIILVARRKDGTHTVYDGQHRVLAARMRDDIQEIPCLVFEFENLEDEAKAFVDSNTARKPMTAAEKFKARLLHKDSDAIAIDAILSDCGYHVCSLRGRETRPVECVQNIERIYRKGLDHIQRVLEISSELYGDKTPRSKVLLGLSCLDTHLIRKHDTNLYRKDIYNKLIEAGIDKVEKDIVRMIEVLGRSGDRVWAQGILSIINHRKTSNRISVICEN